MQDPGFHTLMHKIGKTIRHRRQMAAMTQKELAQRTHISQYYLGKIEQGVANPSIERMSRIAQELTIALSDLLTAD